jgi:lipoprotein-anchoring transpeptidase ErfK/SrfK
MLYLAAAALLFSYTTTQGQRADIVVSIQEQTMSVMRHGKLMKRYPISTSGYGIGDKPDSYKTPLGKHRVVCKVGAGEPIGTIFKTAINTQKKAPIFIQQVPQEEQKDLITTRIIQLDGLEERNKHSYKRGIWIHGTPYEGNIGTPSSHGCVRMRNQDICELYEYIKPEMIVDIVLHSS